MVDELTPPRCGVCGDTLCNNHGVDDIMMYYYDWNWYCCNPRCSECDKGKCSDIMKKVYCKDCKYFHIGSSWDTIDRMYSNFEYCEHKNGHHTIDTYLER